ncbi:type II secretion system F family protein [Solimonas fluminis]|uniref:Type II secretion system F family protein n=1 Tax=Solimonas fluminis TaxID=2086571 RepID=A0A2S5TIC8_9GAMM|nr:type II secretion system F family protein [Solimonas fluminis]PPE74707.1 type II secretion system F family protein [Solimonas fluminis]
MSPQVFAALVAGGILVAVLAILAVIFVTVFSRNERVLKRRLSPEAAPVDELEQKDRPLLQAMVRGGKNLEAMVDEEGESARLLLQAGWRSASARIAWYTFQTVLPLVLAGLVLAFWLLGPEHKKLMYTALAVFVAAALSFLVPRWILRGAASSRQDRIKREVPLFIHLLAMLFDAGLSTRQAFASLVRDSRGVLPELGREFEILLRQIEAGSDMSESLKNLGDMLGVPDLVSVLGVLRQVDRYGGEIRQPLMEVLSVLEERRTLDAREKVNLISGRMTVVMVLFFFPALMIFVAGPAFSSIIKALGDVNAR